MRLLVVEDEPKMNALLVKQLTDAHYTVDSCLDGSDALDYLAGAEYDALVLDIMLPGISGLEILRRMRRAGGHHPRSAAHREGQRPRIGSAGWTAVRTTIWSSPLPSMSCWPGCG